ncbi:MAG: tetratricopeptide repeat protein [Planctomycetes bacterium]|nr:tetratricopeptide repeat protein [Planctomycetota bacterium]
MRYARSSSVIGFVLVGVACLSPRDVSAQFIAPYSVGGAYVQSTGYQFGSMFGNSAGWYFGNTHLSRPVVAGAWSFNQFSNIGFGGLNWYYGPVGGYTPFVTPYGYTTFGYPNFGPYYAYVPLAPVMRQTRIDWVDNDPFQVNPPQPPAGGAPRAQAPRQVNRPQAAPARPVQPLQDDTAIDQQAPNAEVGRRSSRLLAQGDTYFRKQEYAQALAKYKQALALTPKWTEPRFRLALTLVATSNFAVGVDEMKRALRARPDWPRTGAALDDLFGPEGELAKMALLHRATGWTREDIRDPDRLLLMGVLLHFNDDPDRSRPFLEASAALATNPQYAQLFLDNPAAPAAALADPEPVVPAPPAPRDPALRNGPVIPGLEPAAADEPDPVFRGKKKKPEEPRPKPLAQQATPAGQSVARVGVGVNGGCV